MDYERILKPSFSLGGGFSPGKLRSMLLRMENNNNIMRLEDDQQQIIIDSTTCTFTSHSDHTRGPTTSDNYKDVDVVTVFPDSTPPHSIASHPRSKDHSSLNSDSSSDHEPTTASSASFEFHKSQRPSLAPFSKPLPSKWDDAQKWIASPTSTRQRTVQAGPGVASRKASLSRQTSAKVVTEVLAQKMVAFDEPDTKWVDINKENGMHKFVSWETDSYPVADSYGKPVMMIQNSVQDSAISLSRHDSSLATLSATAFIPPPSTARSVSMRDMGTEMTPIASQEPSRTGTPIRATTPIRSPNSSRPSTPGRAAPASSPANPSVDHLSPNKVLSEKELQMKTRMEIIALGNQLGKMNITAWASKEEEDKDASSSLKTVRGQQPTKSVIETRAASWEEAEKAKFLARFKREEMKIQAWENHQKAKLEAEMRKIEVEVERMRGRAQDRLMNKLAAARHKAEEKRAAAEAKRNRQAAKTEQQAEYIRRTGRIPSSFSFCSCCS
ncbi:Remorin family protein [Euphorbia peplus]|nr:Remorin family protein [Euphorbia peplus]